MRSKVKRLIVTGLERTCGVLDLIPIYYRGEGWSRYGQIGCLIGVARWSVRLDDKWGTGVWGSVH